MTESRSEQAVIENLKRIRENIDRALLASNRSPDSLRLMAVTKTVDPSLVNVAIHQGVDLLGENRVQEFLSKKEQYDTAHAEVHFIGTLQKNKVKYLMQDVSMIESVSSISLAKEIERQAAKTDRVMDVLLEVNIGKEESKSGFFAEEIEEALAMAQDWPHLQVKGLMCIPPKEDAEKFFCKILQLFVDNQGKKRDNVNMSVLSMGMSADYELAIRYQSNIVRLGTALFGKRSYPMV